LFGREFGGLGNDQMSFASRGQSSLPRTTRNLDWSIPNNRGQDIFMNSSDYDRITLSGTCAISMDVFPTTSE
jgi:hypothetical protein